MAGRSGENPTVALAKSLESTFESLIDAAKDTELTAPARRALTKRIADIRANLDVLTREIDPIRLPEAVFDPSDPKIVGRFVALAMVAQERRPLSGVERFYGAGVYAIYYRGAFAPYQPISGTETPLYVGKADPQKGARTPMEQGDKLSGRLNEHRKNIERADNVNIADFDYRALVVQSGWQTAAEAYLIHLFRPVWNSEVGILYGLGKHGDAASTRANKRSPWDTMHPGRKWAADESLVDARTVQQIEDDLRDHFAKTRAHPGIESVLSDFLAELRQT